MKYDLIVVGAGFSGSIMARKFAEEQNKKVLLIEQRNVVSGNMYDELDKYGILVQRYGPHFFYTNKWWLVEYLSQYCEMVEHNLKMLSYLDERYVQLPFNFQTVLQLAGPKKGEILLQKLRAAFIGRDRVPVFELLENEDEDIRWYGNLLFDKAYRTYTAKQWGLTTEQIDKSVLNRVQMVMGFDERYINKDFQYLPKEGFYKLIQNIVAHPNIELRLNTDALQYISFDSDKKKLLFEGQAIPLLIFTGAIDELFGEKFGKLPYRAVEFEYRYEKVDRKFPCDAVSYPQADGYTRETEYKNFNYIQVDTPYTVIAREYPMEYDKYGKKGNNPCYPIINDENVALYRRYVEEAEKYDNLFLCGRLAEYKYYNMDMVIESTLEKYEKIKGYLDKYNEK